MNDSTASQMNAGGKRLISVVLPSFNDREIIRPFHAAIMDTLNGQSEYDFELIYVDDGSSDGSQAVLTELARADARVVHIELFRNFGQQCALFAGLGHARGDIVVCMDGDYQYEPIAIIDLSKAIDSGYDMASGVRRNRVEGMFSRVASHLGNRLINGVMRISLLDFGAIKAFSRDLVDRILTFRHCFSDVYPTACYLRPSTLEVEVDHRKRFAGRSHWTFWMRIKLYLDLYVAYGDDNFQGVFRIGVLMCLFGIVLGASVAGMKAILSYPATYIQIGAIAFSVFFPGMAIAGWSLLMSVAVKIFRQNIASSPFIIRTVIDRRDALVAR